MGRSDEKRILDTSELRHGGYSPFQEGYRPDQVRGHVPQATGTGLPKAPSTGTGVVRPATSTGTNGAPGDESGKS